MNTYPQTPDEAVYTFDVEGVMLSREHQTDGRLCWCAPEIETFADGGELVIHRDVGGTEH